MLFIFVSPSTMLVQYWSNASVTLIMSQQIEDVVPMLVECWFAGGLHTGCPVWRRENPEADAVILKIRGVVVPGVVMRKRMNK